MRTTQYGLLALLLGAASLDAAAVESGVDDFSRVRPSPARMRTSFVELRGPKLLKAPLRIEGEYLRPRDDTLVREVHAPYSETTTIRAGEVTIARAGKSPRSSSWRSTRRRS